MLFVVVLNLCFHHVFIFLEVEHSYFQLMFLFWTSVFVRFFWSCLVFWCVLSNGFAQCYPLNCHQILVTNFLLMVLSHSFHTMFLHLWVPPLMSFNSNKGKGHVITKINVSEVVNGASTLIDHNPFMVDHVDLLFLF